MDVTRRKCYGFWKTRLLKVVISFFCIIYVNSFLFSQTKEPIIALRVMPSTLKVDEVFLLEIAVYYEDLSKVSFVVSAPPRNVEFSELQFFRMPLKEYPEIEKGWFDFRGNEVYVRSARYKAKKAGKLIFDDITVLAGEHEIPIEIPPVFVIPEETEKQPVLYWAQTPQNVVVGEKYHITVMADSMPKGDFSISYDIPLNSWLEQLSDSPSALKKSIIAEFEWIPLKEGILELPNIRMEWSQNNIDRAVFINPVQINVSPSTKINENSEEYVLENKIRPSEVKEVDVDKNKEVFQDRNIESLSFKEIGIPLVLGWSFLGLCCLGIFISVVFIFKKQKKGFVVFFVFVCLLVCLLLLRTPDYCETQKTGLLKIPDEKADVVILLPEKTLLKVVQKTGKWYYVCMRNGQTGWVLKEKVVDRQSSLW